MKYSLWLTVFVAIGLCHGGAMSAEQIEVADMVIKPIRRVDVPARQAGVLSVVHAREGLAVSEGELLAKTDDREARFVAELARIEVDVARIRAVNDVNMRFARKSVEISNAELARSESSNKRFPSSVADSEMDRLRLVVQKGELELEQADEEHQVAGFTLQAKEQEHILAQDRVDRHRISSPIKGIIVDVKRRCGEWVEPGQTVATIVRVDRLRAEGFLSVEHANRVAQGRQVEVVVAMPDGSQTPFRGEIVFLDPEVDPINGQVRIWAEIENENLRLRPGMRAGMTIRPTTSAQPQPSPVHDAEGDDG